MISRRLIRPSLPWASITSAAFRQSTTPAPVLLRYYATQSSLGGSSRSSKDPARKQITVTSDDGRLRWSELSGKEKAARATQQSINFIVIIIGAVMTVRGVLA